MNNAVQAASRQMDVIVSWPVVLPLAAQQAPQDYYYHYKGTKVPLVPTAKVVAHQLRGLAQKGKYPTLEKLATEGVTSLNHVGDRLLIASAAVAQAAKADIDLGKAASELLDLPVFRAGRSLVVVQPQVIVQFKPGTDRIANRALLEKFSKQIEELPGPEVYLINIENRNSTLRIANLLFNNNTVLFSEPNFMTVSDLPRFQTVGAVSGSCPANSDAAVPQWNLRNPGQVGKKGADIHIDQVWSKTKGSADVKVAVLDDGVDFSHPALKNRKVGTWDAIKNVGELQIDPTLDSHGTSVAGMIAAEPLTSSSISGVAPNVGLIGIRMASRTLDEITDTGIVLIALGKARRIQRGCN